MKLVECAGGVIRNDRNQIVLIQQEGGSWSFPKGHIDLGESIEECAKREIYEETGLTVGVKLKELDYYERAAIRTDGSFNPDVRKRIYLFLYESKTDELMPLSKDSLCAEWVAIDEVTERFTNPDDREYFIKIKDLIKKK